MPVAASTRVHPSACIDEPCDVGPDGHIWHFTHVMAHSRIGAGCVLGQNVFVGAGVVLGDRVRVQNNVSLYRGVAVESDVFLGPACVLTNVANPRAEFDRRGRLAPTLLRRGCTVGANATVVCGHEVGAFAFVGAGAVVTCDVPAYALMLGVPARPCGYVGRHGARLQPLGAAADGTFRCPDSGWEYALEDGRLRCLSHDEAAPLPPGSGRAP